MAENGAHLGPEDVCAPEVSENLSSPPSEAPEGLSAAQKEILERCLHVLSHAKNDSHILAALLLITRLCPAGQLDSGTLHQIFEAVGLNLPARLLVTALRGGDSSGLPPQELISLGTALLAALSTDASMVSHPQLLRTIPLILSILENGPERTQTPGKEDESGSASESDSRPLDEALARDCYQVLDAVCSSSSPEQLLTRGAVQSLTRVVLKKQTLSQEKALPLLGHLLSSNIRMQAWDKHSSDLLSLLSFISQNFCQASDQARLEMCPQVALFLPPPGDFSENQAVKEIVGNLWAPLRILIQGRLTPEHLGSVLLLSACLLDLCGWESAGPPKFCCLLVNRACVEVRMGLEEPPGTQIPTRLQNTLTACYRIMEAAMEQACIQGTVPRQAQAQANIGGLSLQQSRQVLAVLEEAFSAQIYYLKQVEERDYDDPFVFATVRSLCAWLAEETSCLKDDVVQLLPFLIGYAKSHFKGGETGKGLSDWMSKMSINNSAQEKRDAALRYLLPALCHLSAEDVPRRVLLSLGAPALLVGFLSSGWASLKTQTTMSRDPGLETACSALLNFSITEPERVRSDPCFVALETLLSEALPVLLHKPRLQVLTANCCTLTLMIGRLKTPSTAPADASQRRLFSAALAFLLRGVSGCAGSDAGLWDEALELWRLSLQALSGCVQAQPWVVCLMRDEAWLRRLFRALGPAGRLADEPSQDALEDLLRAVARTSPACALDITELRRSCGDAPLEEVSGNKCI